jgi:very-short-patch-repair endonuclease
MAPLARLSALAARQLSVFTRAQARASGLSAHQLRHLARRGVVEQLHTGVFRFANSTPTWHQRVLAACLDGGPECLASHRTAAALHGFDGFSPGGLVEVVVPMHVRHRRADVIVHHTRDLPPTDRARAGVIPVTSPARTLIDLGAVVPATWVEEAVDAAERDHAVSRAQLERRYHALRAPGRNGIGAMTQVLTGRTDPARVPRSVLERRMIRVLRGAGLPEPVARYRVRLRGGQRYELDFAYPSARLALEVDGHAWHATRRQRAADNERAALLADHGWSIRRFTYEQVVHDREAVAQTVRRALLTAGIRL